MNPWLQRRLFACPGCGSMLLHDKMYRHACFECPGRTSGRQDSNMSDDRRMGELRIMVDHEAHEVVLTGSRGSEIRLTWAAAALLSTLLNEASRQAEPEAPAGKTYCPATER